MTAFPPSGADDHGREPEDKDPARYNSSGRLRQSVYDVEIARLHEATRTVLRKWTDRLRAEAGQGFPEKVTAFREGMAVHGAAGLVRHRHSSADRRDRYHRGGLLDGDLLR